MLRPYTRSVVERASTHAANPAVVVDRRYSWCETCCYSSSHCQCHSPPGYTQQDTGNYHITNTSKSQVSPSAANLVVLRLV